MPDDEKPIGMLQFTEAYLVYRAPQFTISDIRYLSFALSSHQWHLHKELNGIENPERITADQIEKKLRDLLAYMEAAEVSEVDCSAEGKPREMKKPCSKLQGFSSERPH